jgi:ribonucleoside-triphosphate reductase
MVNAICSSIGKREKNMTVIKRDGKVEDLEPKKILNSINKANENVKADEKLTTKQLKRITDSVVAFCETLEEPIDIDILEDVIEKKIMEAAGYEVAKKYITYRYEKERVRNTKFLTEKLTASNVQNQNANVDEYSFGGRMGETASYVTKNYALNNLVGKKTLHNHNNNEVYIHDLDAYAVGSHNCLSIPFDKLLATGFNTRQGDVRPAGSINTAFQLVAVIFQLQSLQQFGGVSATHLDWTMVPYVRLSFWKHYWDGMKYVEGELDVAGHTKEQIRELSIDASIYNKDSRAYKYAMDMTVKELEQAVEGMYHNLNTLQSRSGCQLPFTSINYGTCTSTEGRMVIKALLEGSIKGIGKFHKTSIFPCGIFQCMKGVNRKKGDPNYDMFKLACKSTALRLYPNYANVDWTGNAGYDINNPCTYFSTMGCRTANGWDINCDDPKLGQLKDGRGNICPTTIIMPTLAMQAKKKVQNQLDKDTKNGVDWEVGAFEKRVIDEFMKLLDKKIHEAKDSLLERFDWITSQPAASAKFMYENGTMYGYKPEEGIKSALKHGTLAIGQLGLAETLQILIGEDHGKLVRDEVTNEILMTPGMELAMRIEQLFKERCTEFKNEYKLNFGVYYTPAENLCYTAMKKFKAKYGEIPNVSDHEYFTNSMHVPVWHKMTPFEKIDLESMLTKYSSAGCITYVELDASAKNNNIAIEELVNYAMDKDIPYFAINLPNDACADCGFTDDIPGDVCPKCGSKNIQRLRRVTGYLTGDYKTAFNWGKQKETEDRVKHTCVDA